MALLWRLNPRTGPLLYALIERTADSPLTAIAEDAFFQLASTPFPMVGTVTAGVLEPNLAASSAGSVASASSSHVSGGYAPSRANNSNLTDSGSFWNDDTVGTFPDWWQCDFPAARVISRVIVYSIQDNYTAPIPPTDAMVATLYALKDFTVEIWDGVGWVVVGTVTNNNLVKRTFTFAPVSTTKFRVHITASQDGGYSRLVEVEAYAPVGVLAHNVITQPSAVDHASWFKINCTVIANATKAPDGSMTADQLVESADASAQGHTVGSSYSHPDNALVTVSVYAKRAVGVRGLMIYLPWNAEYQHFTLAGAGSVDYGTAGAAGVIENIGDGWYRCAITAIHLGSLGGGGAGQVNFYISSTGGSITYVGDGVSGIYLWGAELIRGSKPSRNPFHYGTVTAGAISPRCLVFDATTVTTYTVANSLTAGVTTPAFTVEFWCQIDAATGTAQFLLTKNWRIFVNHPSGLSIEFDGPGETGNIQLAGYSLGVPFHAAFSYNPTGGVLTSYLNGVQYSQYTGVADMGGALVSGLYVGSQNPYLLNGKIGQIRIWNGVRTQAEIAANMRKVMPTGTANLVSQWVEFPAGNTSFPNSGSDTTPITLGT